MTNTNVFNQSNGPLFTQLTNTFASPGIGAAPDTGAAASGSFCPDHQQCFYSFQPKSPSSNSKCGG